jgi:hypothetical protein
MAGLMQLRAAAKALGIPAKEVRAADTADALQKLIASGATGGNSGSATAVKKKRGRPKGSTTKTATPKRKPGRPNGSTNKPKTETPKRGPGRPRKASGNGNGGRHLVGRINWSKMGDWNPREDSVPDVIVKALRKFKGDREKTYNFLVKDLKNLVPVKTRNGVKRSTADRQDYLRYLIARNAWAFAMASGQHEKSENRATYGTAGTGTGTFQRKGTRGRKKAQAGVTPRKRTAARQTAAQGARRGPGRPKGSKNKPKRGPGRPRKSTSKR